MIKRWNMDEKNILATEKDESHINGENVAVENGTETKVEGEVRHIDGEDVVFETTTQKLSSSIVMTEKEEKKPKTNEKFSVRIKNAIKNADKKELTLIYSFLIVAAIIRAMSYVVFAKPNMVAPGGITGLSTILSNYVPALQSASGFMMFAFNFPLLVLAFIFLNKKFALYTIIETVLTSAFIALFELPQINFPTFKGDVFLAAICTGALNGFGLGLLLRANCSTGGNDIVGLLIQNKFPKVKVVWLILILDSTVAITAGLVKQFVTPISGAPVGDGLATSIYSFIALFVNSYVAEKIQRGFVSSVKFEVVTEKKEEVGKVITETFHRSATMFEGYGMYTKKPRTMIVAVVRKREAVALKKKIMEIDPAAFFYVSNIHEIVGNGFMVQVNASSKIK